MICKQRKEQKWISVNQEPLHIIVEDLCYFHSIVETHEEFNLGYCYHFFGVYTCKREDCLSSGNSITLRGIKIKNLMQTFAKALLLTVSVNHFLYELNSSLRVQAIINSGNHQCSHNWNDELLVRINFLSSRLKNYEVLCWVLKIRDPKFLIKDLKHITLLDQSILISWHLRNHNHISV